MAAPSRIVIVGAGQAGGWAARTLRDEGFAGRIVLIGEETYPPYERPPLSKEVLRGEAAAEDCHLWPAERWQDWEVELRLATPVAALRRAAKRVALADGETLSYDKLLLATGARVRRLPVPGAGLAGVQYLRTIPDAEAIRARSAGCRTALVVGGGWIGLEVAAALRRRGVAVTLVEAAQRLCARAVTPEIGDWLLALHRRHGVDVRLATGVARFEGEGALQRAVLGDGSVIETTLAVVGIGIVPNGDLAEAAGLAVADGIVVDDLCRTSDPDIFAAGDVASHPNRLLGRRVRLESWENAQNQGIAAARAMLDRGTPYAEIPWFWSDQYDVNLQLAGLPADWDETATRGDPEAGPFITFYLKAGRITGAVAVNQGRDLRFARRLMQAGKQVAAADLADPAVKLQTLLKK